jgi:hypothetical protein
VLQAAHSGPFSFHRTPKPPLAIRPFRCVMCHRRPPSRTRMEPNRSTVWTPSLSCTSSAPVESPPAFTTQNSRELNPHHCWPPASLVPPHLTLPDPIKGTPTPAASSTTHFQVLPHRALHAFAIHHHRRPSSVTPLPNAARGEDPFVLLSLPMKLWQGSEPRSAGEPALR